MQELYQDIFKTGIGFFTNRN